jgi:hypothetical protein
MFNTHFSKMVRSSWVQLFNCACAGSMQCVSEAFNKNVPTPRPPAVLHLDATPLGQCFALCANVIFSQRKIVFAAKGDRMVTVYQTNFALFYE